MIDLTDIPLIETLEGGKPPPKERVKNAKSLRSVFVHMRDDDLVSAANRAEHQALLDNEPPYVEAELREAGQSQTTNLNFGGAEEQLERAMAPYYRLVQSPENLVSVSTLYGPKDERPDWNDILSEELSRMIRKADFYTAQTLLFIHEKTKEGIGVGFFPDSIDWRWRGSGLDQFFFDRQRFASEAEQEVVCALEQYSVTRLWGMVDGDDPGDWNPKAVRAAIQKGRKGSPDFNDWGELQDEIKNNDIFTTQICPPVSVVHGWIQEFDGTWSHYIIPEYDTGVDEFLYKSRQKYRSLSEALVLFPHGLGTNGKIHSIRGLLFKIYPHEQQRNRSIGRLIDGGLRASSLMLQAQDEDAMNSVPFQYIGDAAVLGPEWKTAQVNTPDLQRSVMPALDLMERLRNDRVAGYSSENVFDGDQRKTKAEVMAHLEQSASLSDSDLDFFYGPFEKLLQQSVRRASRKDYLPQDPGGYEVHKMKIRLLRKGVPLEALYQIDWEATEVVRAIGAGSASARTLSLHRLGELRPRMDDVAQERLDRAEAVDAVGAANADIFFPRDGKQRTTSHTNIAILETNQLLRGDTVPVLPSDKHLAHAREHVKPLVEGLQAATGGQATFAEVASSMQPLWVHAATHVDEVEGDPAAEAEAASLRQLLQQVGEVIENGIKELEAAAEEAGPEEDQEGPDPEMAKDMEKHRQKLAQA